MSPIRFSHRGLSPHKFAPMLGAHTLLDPTRYGKPSRSAQRQRYVAKIVKRTATLFLLLGIFLMTNAGDKSLPQLPTVKFTSGRASPSARDRQMGATAHTLLCMETMGQRGLPRYFRKRGVNVREAWNTSKSAHGPWRLSHTPALSLAMPEKLF